MVIRIVQYLKGIINRGMITILDEEKNVSTYTDADWYGESNLKEAELDKVLAKLRCRCVILFMNYILMFASKLQNLVTLSTNEAKEN